MLDILLVEDNPAYVKAAHQHLDEKGHSVIHAPDYIQAIGGLNSIKFNGMISDCFFPEITGSGKTALGLELVGKMAKSDPHEAGIVAGLEALGQYVDLTDPDMRKYARNAISQSGRGDFTETPVFRAIKQVGETIGKDGTTMIVKNTLSAMYDEARASRDYYGALIKAIQESEANQPLGLLTAEKAKELGIPFVLATSTYHHDVLTQPVQNYASRNGWTLIDCAQGREDVKATPGYWQRTLSVLEREMH